MIKLNIVAVGKLKEAYWKDAIAEYTKRISRYAALEIIEAPEVADNGENAASIQQKLESDGIIKRLKGVVVLLDLGGKMVTSTDVANIITTSATAGDSEFTFIIGGSRGVSDEIKNRANFSLCFGKVTYPHQLMRVILAEQLYRAMSIINNSSYHK